MSKIEQTLRDHFKNERIIFWYDGDEGLKDVFDALELPDVTKLILDGDEFSVKYRLLKEEPDAKFLVYSPEHQPKDDDNWLLDLLLANKVFYADKTSLITSDLGFDIGFKNIIQKYEKFFNAAKRTEALKALLTEGEDEETLELKILAAAINCDAAPSAVVLRLQESDKHIEALEKLELQDALWHMFKRNYAYDVESPSLKDFTYKLLQNHFYFCCDRARAPLNREAMLLVRQWMDSRSHADRYRDVATAVAEELSIASVIADMAFESLLQCDTYEACEQSVVVGLRDRILNEKISDSEVNDIVEAREHTYWFDGFANLYKAMLYAAQLMRLIKADPFTITGFDNGITKYLQHWYRIDMLYRKYVYHMNRAEHLQMLRTMHGKVEDIYRNGFLRVVGDKFHDYLGDYTASKKMHQRSFYKQIVSPMIDKGENVVVIISDALRYECGAELASRLDSINRYTAELQSMVCSLPSYTQLGMASLLPHRELELRDKDDTVYVDGQNSRGLPNRARILQATCKSSTTISDEDFLNLSREEGREFVKQYQLIYIFHNEIDKTGDDLVSEEKVFDAVESSFEKIIRLIKQSNSFNRSNIFVTSDHGFLYHNTPTEESELCKYDYLTKPIKLNRRFVIGKDLQDNNCVRKFASSELKLKGDNDILLANSINKLRVVGGGNRFVHGSATLQELIIPLIAIRKKRSDDTRQVDVDVMSIPRITTNTINISFYQKEPVSEKVQPVTLKAGFYSKSGELLTQTQTVTFDSEQGDSRNREKVLRFDFKSNIGQYNNELVTLVLKRVLANSSEEPVYSEIDAQLKLAFFNEFDEF